MSSILRRGICCAALTTILLMVAPSLVVSSCFAAVITKTGASGGPNQPGEDVFVGFNNNSDASNAGSARGGDGGWGDPNGNPAAGRGGNATGTDTEVRAAGDYTLHLEAFGGTGGDSFGSAPGGNGGDATVSADDTLASGSATISLVAEGGTGGISEASADSGTGGTASVGATGIVSGANSLTMSLTGIGGIGGGFGTSGGQGGGVTSSGIFAGGASGPVNVDASFIGGRGGDVGGNGAPVTMDNLISTTGTGIVNLMQNATGGGGGIPSAVTQGAGGAATSTLTISNACSSLNLASNATGGSTIGTSPGGASGGDAFAFVSGHNTGGSVNVSANAQGGAGVGGSDPASAPGIATSIATGTSSFSTNVTVTSAATAGAYDNYVPGDVGRDATATASGWGFGTTTTTATATASEGTQDGSPSGIALSSAHARGRTGSGTAISQVTSGMPTPFGMLDLTIKVNSQTPTGFFTSSAQSWAAIGRTAPNASQSAGYQSHGSQEGLPSNDESLAAMSSSPHVQRDFNVGQSGAIGPASTALGLVTLGAGSSSDGLQHTFTLSTSAKSYFSFSNPQDLVIGFLNPTSTGKGFDSLTFTITRNDSIVQRVTFDSIVIADAYFTDDPIDLGPILGMQSLQFDFVLTSTDPADSYSTEFIYGNAVPNAGVVPEPTAPVLMILVAAAGLIRRRKPSRALLS